MSDLTQDMPKYGIDLSVETLKLLKYLLDTLGDKAEYIKGEVNMDILLKHIKNGGTLKEIQFSKNELETMQKCLKDENVLYHIVGVKDSNNYICIYRDIDFEKIDRAKERFNILKGIGVSELSPDRFLEVFKNDTVGSVKYKDKVDVELMRYHLNNKGIAFSVIEKDDTQELIYPINKQNELDLALKSTAWDLTSSKAPEIKKEIEQKIKVRTQVLSIVEAVQNHKPLKEPLYLVDSNNPNRFLQITTQGIIQHELAPLHKKIIDENNILVEKEFITDIKTDLVSNKDKDFYDKFFKSMNSLGNNIIPLKPSEFVLIRDSNDLGELTLIEPVEDFKKARNELSRVLKQIDRVYPNGYTPVNEMDDKVDFIRNLSKEEEFELYQELKDLSVDYYLNNGELAWKEKDVEIIQPVLDKVLYKENKELSKEEIEYNKTLKKLNLKGNKKLDKDSEYIIIDLEELEKKPIRTYKSQFFAIEYETTFNAENLESIPNKVLPETFKKPLVLTIEEYEEFSNLKPEEKILKIEAFVHEIENCSTAEILKNSDKAIKKAIEEDVEILINDNTIIDTSKVEFNTRIMNNEHFKNAVQKLKTTTIEVLHNGNDNIQRELTKINKDKAHKRKFNI